VTHDILSNPVTTDRPATLAGINDFVDGFLSYERKAANALEAADADPTCCLINVYAAMLWMFLEGPGAAEGAEPYLQRAEAVAERANPRERAALAFVRAWAREDAPAALAIGAEINAAHPRDMVMLKLRQYLHFNAGNAPAMLRTVQDVLPAVEDVAQAHGMFAFALEQCHLLEEAEAAARKALTIKAKEPWAQHAVAHVMITQGRIDEGATFMEAASSTWTDLSSFMSTHNWWHLALFYLSQGRDGEALRLYDQGVWGVEPTYTQDQVGAVSLLTRLELAGVEVGDRWSDLAGYLAARENDAVLPFLSLQYLYGLGRAGRAEAQRLLAAIEARAETAPSYERAVWAKIAAPAARGLFAHTQGRFAEAAEQLGEALPKLALIGGSHAQRDLFEQIWLDALIRSGATEAAQQVLELRRQADPDGVPVNSALAAVYRRLGLEPQALRAADRAAATRARFAG
jgi:tetratricopeptide (TPR) repeat protein